MFFTPNGCCLRKRRKRMLQFLFYLNPSFTKGGKKIKHPLQETILVQRGGVWSDRSGPSAPRRLSILLSSWSSSQGKDTSWVQSATGPTLLTWDPILHQLPPPGTARWPRAGAHPYHQWVGWGGRAASTSPASDTHLCAGRTKQNSRAASSLGEKDLSWNTAWGPQASLWGEDLKTWLERKVWEGPAAREKQGWACGLTGLHLWLPQRSQQLPVWQLTSSWEGIYWLTGRAKLSQKDLRRNLHCSAEIYSAAVSPCTGHLTSLGFSFLICEGKNRNCTTAWGIK